MEPLCSSVVENKSFDIVQQLMGMQPINQNFIKKLCVHVNSYKYK